MESKVEINELETKRMIQQINKAKSSFFEKMNEINKPLKEIN
jgi:hypothetical protein